ERTPHEAVNQGGGTLGVSWHTRTQTGHTPLPSSAAAPLRGMGLTACLSGIGIAYYSGLEEVNPWTQPRQSSRPRRFWSRFQRPPPVSAPIVRSEASARSRVLRRWKRRSSGLTSHAPSPAASRVATSCA